MMQTVTENLKIVWQQKPSSGMRSLGRDLRYLISFEMLVFVIGVVVTSIKWDGGWPNFGEIYYARIVVPIIIIAAGFIYYYLEFITRLKHVHYILTPNYLQIKNEKKPEESRMIPIDQIEYAYSANKIVGFGRVHLILRDPKDNSTEQLVIKNIPNFNLLVRHINRLKNPVE